MDFEFYNDVHINVEYPSKIRVARKMGEMVSSTSVRYNGVKSCLTSHLSRELLANSNMTS